ncbi:EAL domain-containing protein [Thioalkalivibrio sp. ALJ1]|uniref:EAL domain-containing protein n=1 Tax=Thioalkalivibrio sp. ALJ1 TaxID=1158144 RepID=UPI00056F64EB|nr:EAL domain-containing protein [Thioalkalivibrio sp. ALJ1]
MMAERRVSRPLAAGLIAGSYVVLGLLWIALSDVALAWWGGTDISAALTRANLGKGFGFVLVSGLLLYVAMRWLPGGLRELSSATAHGERGRFGPWPWLLLALAVVMSTGGVGLATWYWQGMAAETQAQEDLQRAAFLKGGVIDQWLAERTGDAEVLAEARGFNLFAVTALERRSALALGQVRDRLDLMRTAYDYDGVALLDANRQPVIELGRSALDEATMDMVLREVRRSGEISEPILHANPDGRPRVSWVVPVRDRAAPLDPVVGLVLLSSTIKSLHPLLTLTEGRNGLDALAHVVVREGDQRATIARITEAGGVIIPAPMAFPTLRERVLDHPRDGVVVERFDDADVAFLAGIQGLAPAGWDLVLKRELDALQALPRQHAVWAAGATLFLWLAVLGTGGLLWRQQWLQRNLALVQAHADQDRLLGIFFDMPFVGMAISGPRGEGWERVNACLADMLGYAPTELAAMDWHDRLSVPQDRGCDTALDAEMRRGERSGYSIVKRMLRRDGRVMVADIDVKCSRTPQGNLDRVVATVEDITEQREQEERQRLASVVFENTREGVVITDATAHILSVNRAFTELMGYSQDEVAGRTPKMFQSGRHDHVFYANMRRELEENGHWQGEIWNRRKNGEIFPELQSITAVRDSQGRLTHYVSVFADISRIKASEAELDFLAHHDPLTELPNRRLLRARLAHGISLMRRREGHLALLILDIDRFKDINDSQGHAAGDRLLKIVAERLQAGRRGTDTVARLASDEFAVLVENLGHVDDAARVAENIIREVGHPCDLGNGIEMEVAATIGIAVFPDHATDADMLLQQAGTALSQAKLEGRGSYRYYSDEFARAARDRIDLSARLRRALEQDALEVHYQPQYNVADGRLLGAEALLRWSDPELGPISPGRFIPLAEQTGLIVELGAWVLRRVIAQGREWQAAGYPPVRLAVNVSALQFQRVPIDQQVGLLLEEYDFPADQLELEITESALMADPGRARRILQRLRERGVHFAIDDFGTGYSSMAQLKRFPVDTLKIDKSFVDGLAAGDDDERSHDLSIARSIVGLGHGLGLSVLAEGVETAEQLAVLKGLGCDHYQGFYASRPIPAPEFASVLDAVVASR